MKEKISFEEFTKYVIESMTGNTSIPTIQDNIFNFGICDYVIEEELKKIVSDSKKLNYAGLSLGPSFYSSCPVAFLTYALIKISQILYLKDEEYLYMKEYYTFDFIKGRVKKISAPKNKTLIEELPLFKSKEDIMKALVYYKYLFKIYSDEFGKKCQAKSE